MPALAMDQAVPGGDDQNVGLGATTATVAGVTQASASTSRASFLVSVRQLPRPFGGLDAWPGRGTRPSALDTILLVTTRTSCAAGPQAVVFERRDQEPGQIGARLQPAGMPARAVTVSSTEPDRMPFAQCLPQIRRRRASASACVRPGPVGCR